MMAWGEVRRGLSSRGGEVGVSDKDFVHASRHLPGPRQVVDPVLGVA